MIGNAVPVNLGRFIAEGIKEYIINGSRKEKTLLDYMGAKELNDCFEMPSSPLRKF